MTRVLMFRIALLFIVTLAPLIAVAEVNIDKELFITDLKVVNHPAESKDPNGAFHIRTLLANMAPYGATEKEVLLSLVNSLKANSPDLPSRDIDRVIKPWKRWKLDGTLLAETDPLPDDATWEINWSKAPFRLTAIVNRLDLKQNPNIANAGEGRFVFCAVDPLNPETGSPTSFTLILEYIQPAATEADVLAVATEWHVLGSFPDFNADYITQLKKVTAHFAGKGAMPTRPNGSALGQLRTNEILLNPSGGPGWELRELAIGKGSGLLESTTVKLTPHHALDNTEVLSFLLRSLGPNVSEQVHESILDKRSITGLNSSFQWQAPAFPVADAVLRRFSVNTCAGCHGGDARTADLDGFYQLAPRKHDQPARRSRFLTGLDVAGNPSATPIIDPATGQTVTAFSDLAVRKLLMEAILGISPPAPAPEMAKSMQQLLRASESRSMRVH